MAIENFASAWMTDEHRMLEDPGRCSFNERWVPRATAQRAAGEQGL